MIPRFSSRKVAFAGVLEVRQHRLARHIRRKIDLGLNLSLSVFLNTLATNAA
jgi:hypothetical protein